MSGSVGSCSRRCLKRLLNEERRKWEKHESWGLWRTGVSLSIKSIISVLLRLILSIDCLITDNRSHHFTATATLFPRALRGTRKEKESVSEVSDFCLWIMAIKNASRIKLIKEKKALAWVSLARVKRHTKPRWEITGEKKRECRREGKESQADSI